MGNTDIYGKMAHIKVIFKKEYLKEKGSRWKDGSFHEGYYGERNGYGRFGFRWSKIIEASFNCHLNCHLTPINL